ncbi:hypothetical protein I8748_16305 [Nostoc sp. CENA67]|uniref:Uncharacterized protein n=1 Tax=Amazonocrinis nigriterrae CENA67 TaxID=2794033 RepID=A0A8J7L7S8_9NOST|nr:hypothetical protein [Amazonocrinis nigriterrae]MBH8563734.1 hypothetical protein [Amazonocrinis nigriterrae CENA67]
MSEQSNQHPKKKKLLKINASKKENKPNSNFWIVIVSLIAVGYVIFSLISPMFLKQGQQPPRKIETPDIILIALVLLFNSDLLNRLEDFGISREGGVTARFKQLKQEVDEQKKQIDELQEQQLEQLRKQQDNLEEVQAFMYNFLVVGKDYDKIDQLDKHCEANKKYDFYVSEEVAKELRRLRDLKLIETNSGLISDVVQASNNGKKSIDLTKYFHVTDLGKKFLKTREVLQSKNQQQTINPLEIPKLE